jgi:hypothetical protein
LQHGIREYHRKNPGTIVVPLSSLSPVISINVTGNNPPPDFFKWGLFRIISEKIKNLLSSIESVNAEYIPITLLYKNKPAKSSYYILNVLDYFDCVDYASSKIGNIDSFGISKIERLSIIKTTIPKDIFVLEPLRIDLIISKKIVAELCNIKATGSLFLPFEKFRESFQFDQSIEYIEI